MGLMSDAFKKLISWSSELDKTFHIFRFLLFLICTAASFTFLPWIWMEWFHRFSPLNQGLNYNKSNRIFLRISIFHCVCTKNCFFLNQCNEETNLKIQKPGSTAIVFQLSTGLSNFESMPLVQKVHYTWVHMISIWIFQFCFSMRQYPLLSIKRSSTYDGDWNAKTRCIA